jgi:hypothetical protein
MVADRTADDARRQPLDHGADARRAEALIVFAPADNAVVGGELDEVIVAPAGIGSEGFDGRDFHGIVLLYAVTLHRVCTGLSSRSPSAVIPDSPKG